MIGGSHDWPPRLSIKADFHMISAFAALINQEFEHRNKIAAIKRRTHSGKTRGTMLYGPWVSGSFYLFAVIIMTTLLTIVSNFVPAWLLILVVVGAVLLSIVVGAMQLRQDDALKDESFVRLIAEMLKRMVSFKA
jgi:hypothetical protein